MEDQTLGLGCADGGIDSVITVFGEGYSASMSSERGLTVLGPSSHRARPTREGQSVMIRSGNGVWEVRCDRCDHGLRTGIGDRTAAARAAQINGWAFTELTLCPGCATTAYHDAHR